MSDTSTITRPEEELTFGNGSINPALLVAYGSDNSTVVDRCLLTDSFSIGRGSECDLQIVDDKISRRHARITYDEDGFGIEDLGSSNKTYVNGVEVAQRKSLIDQAVIRVGQALLVFHQDATPMLDALPSDRYGIIGQFHAVPLLNELNEATISARHILLAGPTGSGKELAAGAIASIMGKQIRFHNAARFASADEAASTLFGVAPKTFTAVNARPGLIEQAEGGILFLDEIHNLPERVQRSLLRIMEDGYLERIGDTRARKIDVQFVLASNAPGPTHSLAEDLLARLRAVRIPPLSERLADIPSIFDHIMRFTLRSFGLDGVEIAKLLSADHYESLCLDGFPGSNVRGLVDLADRIATRIKAGAEPSDAIMQIFSKEYSDGPVVQRQGMRFGSRTSYRRISVSAATRTDDGEAEELVGKAYQECGGNVSAIDRSLRERGFRYSRRKLSTVLDRLKLPRIKKPRS